MRLGTLIAEAGLQQGDFRLVGDEATEVAAISLDSRAVAPATLFVCITGGVHDGHDHAPAAVAAGAVALVTERPLGLEVPQLVVASARAVVGPLADALCDHPTRSALRVVGVTGTNGKTTTCALLEAIFEAHGWRTSTIGTLTQARTTPEAPELQAKLAEWRERGGTAVAMEVSSHALDQRRVDAVHFAAGVLTNVTQDHLDYHRSMDAYFEAKARLFEPGRVDVAVVNRTDAWGQILIERLRAGRRPVETFATGDAGGLELAPAGSRFRWEGQAVQLSLGGRFNVDNALAAATTARALGVPAATVARGLQSVRRVPGRFESVDAGQPFTVVVDYAHTPDGLDKALRSARELTTGRLIVVFGAGGDRDHAKRPLMGEVAARLADLSVITSDNPRTEDPEAIIADVMEGAPSTGRIVVEADRAAAIAAAVAAAGAGDVVVVAGKGHETGQDIGGCILPFDDVAATREALERILRFRAERTPIDGGR
ncbi:MAG: UDP-N-acetylmuramoyl-L-alanyl-D-glutamate--2,6-diaminopimelate ligase [Actinomycetota bacterium]|nr:UDP-N-acetylmuramoyl-L-alanyl-D-glutamate--2,6-diaminopimelate ligase [Actinomycetota bacterium]